MKYIIGTIIGDALILFMLYMVKKNNKKEITQTGIRKLKNIFLTIGLLLFPGVLSWSIYQRILTDQYIEGKTANILGLLTGYLIMGYAGRILEPFKGKDSFNRIFYYIFEALALYFLFAVVITAIFS